jgi:UDP-N-acetylglucosamine 4,6-dehydratase
MGKASDEIYTSDGCSGLVINGGWKDMNFNWRNQIILLTGGTGSFGQKFTEIMLRRYHPKAIRIFSRDEWKQSEMQKRFKKDKTLRFFLGDVRDKDRLRRAMEGATLVVHAAALKQVPLCEYNPFEAIQTNVLGAKNVIDAGIDTGVPRIMALSTDKAVNPVNLYGASKLCAEKLFIQGNSYAGARASAFSCVRYGNVVGSRGSVLPLFQEQGKTGTLTVTDPRMTRFWITLEKGVRFVVDCIERMRGGELFIPKIPSMKVLDMAKAVCPSAKIKFIGIRSGEKLHEVLLSEDEGRQALDFGSFFVIPSLARGWEGKGRGVKTLPAGFRYASDTNPDWLTPAQLKAMVG